MPGTKRSTNNPFEKLRASTQPTTNNKKRKSRIRSGDTRESLVTQRPSFAVTSSYTNGALSFLSKIERKHIVIAFIILVIILLGYYKKNWFIAAMVNGAPITNLEVLNRMNTQFREQTLTQLINQKIILDEAGKNGIAITEQDINDKIAQIENDFGGKENLDNLLSSQGQTRGDLNKELRLQLVIEKLYASQATVSGEEVDSFITQNKNQLVATESGAQRREVEERIKQQKLSTVFNQKFQELKAKANVVVF